MNLDDEALDRLRELAAQAQSETLPGWHVQGRGIASGGVVVDEDGQPVCECYGSRERFTVAEFFAALEPAVVLELIRRIEYAERPRSVSRPVDESQLGGQAVPRFQEAIRLIEDSFQRARKDKDGG